MFELPKLNHRKTLLVTGLGNDKVVDRQNDVVNWLNNRRPLDAQIHVFRTSWQTNESYRDKRQRLLSFISAHAGIEVVYGISAGASLGMSIVPEMPLSTEYHFISGKLQNPENIGVERNLRAPAFKDSVEASEDIIYTHELSDYDMTCYAGYLDGVLKQKDMRIPGVPFERIPMVNHSVTIALAYLTVLRRL